MFLPKDFLQACVDDPVSMGRQPSASTASPMHGEDLSSRPASSGFGGGTYSNGFSGDYGNSSSSASGPNAANGRPYTAPAMASAGDDDPDDTATPMSTASLRQKMLQQRQRTLQKHRGAGMSASSSNMVMANESLASGEAATSGRSPTAAGVTAGSPSRPGLGRSASAMASPMGFGSPFGQDAGDFRPHASPNMGSWPGPVTLESTLSSMSLSDKDTSGLIMPEMCVDSKEEEARRRSSLAQELDERGICPVYDPTPTAGKESAFDISSISPQEMKGFLLNPSPKHAGMVECRIIRERGGLNKLFPKYIVESDSGVFLMTAKKQKHNKTSNYAISMSRSDAVKDSDSFLGKLRSNFLGLEFISYGTGLNPKKIDPTMSQVHAIQLARQEMVAVQYSSSLWGTKPRGPRKMFAVIPRVQPSGERLVCRTLHPDTEGLLAMHKGSTPSNLIDCYHNKPPKWNEQIGAFVLNFNKRVTQASVKNFQLTNSEDPDTVYLQFGRVGKDVFNMDFRHPFSPFQAFAICLSSFDYKLCCE